MDLRCCISAAKHIGLQILLNPIIINQMRTTSSIAFFCRKSKQNKQGYSPLECSVTLSGSRKFLNLPMKFKPEDFNRKRPSQDILEALDLWRSRINSYMVQMMKEGMVITATTLRNVIQSGGVRAYSVGTLFDDYLLILRKRVGVDLKESVYRKYELTTERVLEFIDRDADVSSITPHLVKTIEVAWRGRYDPATLVGYLTRFKTFVKYGMANGKIQIDPFQGIKITKPVKPIKFLTEAEINHLLTLSLEPRLQRVLDLFLIQCGTGMAYVDLMDFTLEDLNKEGEHYYISKHRNKTGRVFTALVLPFAVDIILHYKTLPRITNQVYNRFLKEIDPRLTTHMGRRSYASYLCNHNVSMDVVAAAIGDSPVIASRYYAKLLNQTIIKEQIRMLKK